MSVLKLIVKGGEDGKIKLAGCCICWETHGQQQEWRRKCENCKVVCSLDVKMLFEKVEDV
jgi:hypothetical protein